MSPTQPMGFYEVLNSYVPMMLVFMSGFGFSIQSLVIKLLAMNNYSGSFSCVMSRGICQIIICSGIVYFDQDRRAGKGPKLFGDTPFVRNMLILRSITGFGSIAGAFLAVEYMSVGDSSTLVMLSPIFAAILGYVILGEPWRLPEFIGAVVAMAGAVLVARPSFIFGGKPADPIGVTIAVISAISAASAFICIRILGTSAKMPYANIGVSQAIAQIVISMCVGVQ